MPDIYAVQLTEIVCCQSRSLRHVFAYRIHMWRVHMQLAFTRFNLIELNVLIYRIRAQHQQQRHAFDLNEFIAIRIIVLSKSSRRNFIDKFQRQRNIREFFFIVIKASKFPQRKYLHPTHYRYQRVMCSWMCKKNTEANVSIELIEWEFQWKLWLGSI